MPPTIEINHVTKRFGHTTAVDDVSLTIPAGCVFALLGENGAGKTTLVRMLLGLLPPDAGSITVLGMSTSKQGEEIRQRVGYVPERPTLYDWMTASEIGWFTAGFYPDGFEQQYRNLLDRYRVPAARKISQMSKGMRSKVALSLALAPQPELLVLDEPTSGLDTLVRREFLESMVDLAAEGRTVVLSSHLIGEVERIADHVAILKSGQTLTIDPLDELKRHAFDVTLTMHSAAAPLPLNNGPPLPGRVLHAPPPRQTVASAAPRCGGRRRARPPNRSRRHRRGGNTQAVARRDFRRLHASRTRRQRTTGFRARRTTLKGLRHPAQGCPRRGLPWVRVCE